MVDCPLTHLSQMSFMSFKQKINDLFGSPGTGIHSYRIFNIAYLDVLGTMIAASAIHKLIHTLIPFIPLLSYSTVLISLFIVGIILHRIFGARTTIDKILFP